MLERASGGDADTADGSPGRVRDAVVGLAGGVDEAGVARPNSDAKGLDRRGPTPPDDAGCICLALGRGGRGGPFALGRGGSVMLAVCPWTENDGYEGASREF